MEDRTSKRYHLYIILVYLYFIAASFLSFCIYKSFSYLLLFLYIAIILYVLCIAANIWTLKASQWKIKRIKKRIREIKRKVVKGEIGDIDFQREEAILENEEIKANIQKLKAMVELKYLRRFNIPKFLLAKSYIKEILNTSPDPKNVTRDEVMRQLLINSTRERKNKRTTKKHLADISRVIKEILLPKPHEYERIKEVSLRAKLNKIKRIKKSKKVRLE